MVGVAFVGDGVGLGSGVGSGVGAGVGVGDGVGARAQAQQIWDLKQTTLQNHALKIDIVYEDTAYPLAEEYQNTYYWTQNK